MLSWEKWANISDRGMSYSTNLENEDAHDDDTYNVDQSEEEADSAQRCSLMWHVTAVDKLIGVVF